MIASLNRLRNKAENILRLPDQAQQVVEAYLHIRIDGADASCPYHINPGLRTLNRALLGKGRPEEIESIARKYFAKYAMQVKGDSARLRTFLSACGIGVDCSGFAAWVLNEITQANIGRPLWHCVNYPGLRRSVISKLRPIENLSASLLTGQTNAQPISNLGQLKPGDLIRTASWHHVVIITEVGMNEAGIAFYFCYAQSSCMYGSENGVRTGYAVIKNSHEPLLAQEWFDNYPRCIIKELIAEGGDSSQTVRLRALA